MKLIARPVLAYRPVISPTAIYGLYRTYDYMKRVPGGICRFTEPSRYNNHELSDNYLELNEYGIVYYVMKLHEYEADTISMYEFIDGIDELLKYARRLYNACDAIVTIKVIAELENVFEKKMPRRLISDQIHLNSEPVCYTSKVSASTSKTYLSRDLKDPAHQKTIFEELIMQLLWAFNIPTDNEHLIGYIRKVTEDRISE